MIAASNGRFMVCVATEREGSTDSMDFRVLGQGYGGNSSAVTPLDSSTLLNAKELREAIDDAVGRSRPTTAVPTPRAYTAMTLDPSLVPRAPTDEERVMIWRKANFY